MRISSAFEEIIHYRIFLGLGVDAAGGFIYSRIVDSIKIQCQRTGKFPSQHIIAVESEVLVVGLRYFKCATTYVSRSYRTKLPEHICFERNYRRRIIEIKIFDQRKPRRI